MYVRWFQAIEMIPPGGVLLYELEGKEFSINRHLGLVGIVSVADLRISRFGELLKMAERVNFALKLGPSGPAPPHSRGKTGPHNARQLPTHVAAVPAVHLASLRATGPRAIAETPNRSDRFFDRYGSHLKFSIESDSVSMASRGSPAQLLVKSVGAPVSRGPGPWFSV